MEIFGIHEQALKLKSMRAEILADNLINSSTPGFKARDFDFHKMLQEQTSKVQKLSGGNTHHIGNKPLTSEPKLAYRVPMQNSVDGNTVETDIEQMLYAQNALEYKATLSFIRHRAANIIQALRGGE